MHITLPRTVNHELKIAVPVVRADTVQTNLNRTELPIIITRAYWTPNSYFMLEFMFWRSGLAGGVCMYMGSKVKFYLPWCTPVSRRPIPMWTSPCGTVRAYWDSSSPTNPSLWNRRSESWNGGCRLRTSLSCPSLVSTHSRVETGLLNLVVYWIL